MYNGRHEMYAHGSSEVSTHHAIARDGHVLVIRVTDSEWNQKSFQFFKAFYLTYFFLNTANDFWFHR
jgi:hypothetical protein